MQRPDLSPTPTLWVGTSCGAVVVISLTMPDNMDNRVLCLQTVLATPTRKCLEEGISKLKKIRKNKM